MAAKKSTRKKVDTDSWMGKLKDWPRSRWTILFIVAVVLLVAPILMDLIMPAQGVDESVTDKNQLVIIEDKADLLTDTQEENLKSICCRLQNMEESPLLLIQVQ